TSTRLTESSFSSVARAAGTTVSGPRSPPIASRAIVTLRLIGVRIGWSTGRRPRGRALLLFDRLRNLDDLPPAGGAGRGHVVPPVRLARRLVAGAGGPAKGIMGTTHATPRRRLARFLHSHFQVLPIRTNRGVTRQPPASRRQPRSSLTIPAEG